MSVVEQLEASGEVLSAFRTALVAQEQIAAQVPRLKVRIRDLEARLRPHELLASPRRRIHPVCCGAGRSPRAGSEEVSRGIPGAITLSCRQAASTPVSCIVPGRVATAVMGAADEAEPMGR